MKKKINITLSEEMLDVCDQLARSRGMNRSEYINYLINVAADKELELLKTAFQKNKK